MQSRALVTRFFDAGVRTRVQHRNLLGSMIFLVACEGSVERENVARDAGVMGTMQEDAAASDAGRAIADGGSDNTSNANVTTDAGQPRSPDAGPLPITYSTDRNEFFGTVRCPSSALLCEDFESGIDSSRWKINASNNGTSLTVDEAHHARGAKALHVRVTSGFSQAFLTEKSTFPAASNVLYGRLFFYIEGPIPSQFNHWTMIEATGTENNSTMVQVRYGGIDNPGAKAHHFLFNYEKQPRPSGFDELGIDDSDVPGGRKRQIDSDVWHCVEWMFDSTRSEARFFWDGTERPMHPIGEVDGTPMKFPPFEALNIGFTDYQAFSTPYNVWIDSVAIDTKRIGCQR